MVRTSLVLVSLIGYGACSKGGAAPASTGEAPSPVAATQKAPATPAEVTPPERARMVDQVAHEMEAHYVFPDVGAKMAATIRERAARGGYDALSRSADFADVLTQDLRAISHDRHALVERTPPPGAASAEDAEWERLQAENRATSGLGATERLPGNVAHLVLRSFEPLDAARAALSQRLSALADASALILDVRDNSGGDPETVAFVASYLFGEVPVHLNDMWWRDSGKSQAFFTLAQVPGKRFGATKPVVVLTSKHTFSAAEELAYDVQSLKRAKVIGEATAGGAHPVAIYDLSPVLKLRIPTGRAINPWTGTDWEGSGVKPDVAVDAKDALDAAQKMLSSAIRK
jgi:hypothetical protein